MLAIAILAAGKGTRMKSNLPKVLHPLAGKSLIERVLSSTKGLKSTRQLIIVGHKALEIEQFLKDLPNLEFVHQQPQNGTGHAIQQLLPELEDFKGELLVLNGDVPLLTETTLKKLLDFHKKSKASVTFLSATLSSADGYGRVFTDKQGYVTNIIEDSECNEQQRKNKLTNAGIYCFDYKFALENILELDTDNKQNEVYLTDLIGLASSKKQKILVEESSEVSIMGVNSMDQLHNLEKEAREHVIKSHADNGVYFQDPSTAYIDESVQIGSGTKILANTHLLGDTTVGENCTIGLNSMITDSEVGSGSTVLYSVISESSTQEEVQVGPYAHLRPGSNLGKKVKVGSFAETKKSNIGDGSKVPHLAYVGDGEVGENVNFSAGSITVNYDGENKHKTTIEDGAFIGSDVMLVAPVTIGEGAYIGAGSVITKDVPSKALGVERSEQKNIEGYSDRKKKKKEDQ